VPALRLSHKLFLASALMIGVVLSVAWWSLLATRRLGAENRAIIHRALPAVRLEVTVLEGVAALRRLDARHSLLRDPAYFRLFAEHAQAIEGHMTTLGTLVSTPEERQAVADAAEQLQRYRALAERPPGDRGTTEHAALRLEALAARLYAQSSDELRRRGAVTEALDAEGRLVALLAVGTSLAMALAMAAFANRRIARPLRELRVAARSIERRKLSEPIPVRGQDEIADLAVAFNRMSMRLHELDTLKQHLFSAITHDLRTPLTVIAWSADRLAQGAPGALGERQASLVENIRMSTRRLLSLVSQLLDLGKLKTGKLQLDLDPTDVASLVQGAVDEVRPWAEDRGLRFAITVSDSIPKLLLDAKRMHQVLVNLLANAVKFSKAGALITLTAEAAGPELLVKVSDTGIGIPAHLQAAIFERYAQAHGERDGTGLGLAIVKGFVVAHGGRVWVESEEGKGSCFSIALPLEAPNPSARDPPGAPAEPGVIPDPCCCSWRSWPTRPAARRPGRGSRPPSRPTAWSAKPMPSSTRGIRRERLGSSRTSFVDSPTPRSTRRPSTTWRGRSC
jgi:signal transduction histidine kinase